MRESNSLLGKFVRTLLSVCGLIGVSTLALFVWTSTQTSAKHLKEIGANIENGISSKGVVLTTSNALALRSLTLDNAFLDMQRLIEQGVKQDADLLFGIFVNSDHVALALSKRGVVDDRIALPPDAWKELGLSQDELLVDKLTTKRVTRLGKELLEVAAPVVSEDGELLGTIRYGLSTRRMHDALEAAKRDADARLQRSLAFISAMVAAATLLGLMLSRAQAVRITRPVGDLTRAAEELARGRHSVRVQVDSGDELARLATSFNRMVTELDASYRELQRMNRTLEEKVVERTAELAVKNRDMQLVLDNVDQGLLTLSLAGAVHGEPSRIVVRWFGGDYAGKHFAEYLGALNPDFAGRFRIAWSQVEDNVLPVEVSLDQLPTRLSSAGRTWTLRYLPYHHDGNLDGVLVVLDDITERIVRERQDAEQSELMQCFGRLMADRTGFTAFMREATRMVDAVAAGNAASLDLRGLKRTLHTLKGNAGVMGLTVVARLCHELEDQLRDGGVMSHGTIVELRDRWHAIQLHVARFVGHSTQPFVDVSEAEYAALVSYLSTESARSEMLRRVLGWKLEPAERPLQRLADQAKGLSKRLGKGDIDVEVRAPGVRLDAEAWAPFYADMVHLVRNAVDHGLESPEERGKLGKPQHGKVTLRAELRDGALVFEVGDDGRGIDWPAIIERAEQRGLPHQTRADLVLALCTDGIATMNQATDVSGRGVGMAALKRRVDALRGSLAVKSAEGQGTTWIVRIPALPSVTDSAA